MQNQSFYIRKSLKKLQVHKKRRAYAKTGKRDCKWKKIAKKSDFIDIDEIMEGCRKASAQGIDRYCIVTAGRAISPADFEKALAAYKKMRPGTDKEGRYSSDSGNLQIH